MSHLMEHQIVDAALTCIGRVGIAKTTLDDVGREAGCARATVYRYFPGKQPLINAAVATRSRPPHGRGADRRR